MVLIVIALVAAAGFGLFRLFMEDLRYSKKRTDLTQYLGITAQDDAAIILNHELLTEYAKLQNGRLYFSASQVSTMLNKRFYYSAADGTVRYCLPDQIIETVAGSSEWTDASGVHTEEYPMTMMIGDTLYYALDFVQRYTSFDYRFTEEPSRVVLTTDFTPEDTAVVSGKTALRVSGGIRSDIVTDLAKDQALVVLDQMETWSRVMTMDGLIGYAENRKLKDFARIERTPQNVYTEPEYPSLRTGEKVNLAWFNVEYLDSNSLVFDYLANTHGITVVAPTWYRITDEEGSVTSIASADIVSRLHENGYKVWATLMNFSEAGSMQTFLATASRRQRVIDTVVADAKAIGADGINADLELIEDQYGRDYIEFIRELSIACRAAGLVLSVDNYVPYDFNNHYDMGEQGVFADYVVIMGYDEHFGGSQEAGSVASLSYVRNGIERALTMVPADRLINGVPFYTRVWKGTDGNLSSIAIGMSEVQQYIRNNNLPVIWNETDGQNYAEGVANDGVYARVWVEDAQSIRMKLNVMQANGLAGVASWRLGYETPDIWDVIGEYMNE